MRTSRQPHATVPQFMPDRCCYRAQMTVLTNPHDDQKVRSAGDRTPPQQRGNDTGIEQVSEIHRATLRPRTFARIEAKKCSSTPISSMLYFSRKPSYATLKLDRSALKRSKSRTETTTATGSPRRVNSTSRPDCTSSTIFGRLARAYVTEYFFMIQVYIQMYT